MSYAVPPIAGGSVVVLSLMFNIFLKGDMSYLGLATSILILIDFVVTGLKIGIITLQCVILDNKYKKQLFDKK